MHVRKTQLDLWSTHHLRTGYFGTSGLKLSVMCRVSVCLTIIDPEMTMTSWRDDWTLVYGSSVSACSWSSLTCPACTLVILHNDKRALANISALSDKGPPECLHCGHGPGWACRRSSSNKWTGGAGPDSPISPYFCSKATVVSPGGPFFLTGLLALRPQDGWIKH